MPAPHSAPIDPASLAADRFAVCVARVVDIEGGFVNNPADRGGATKAGISLAFLNDRRDDPWLHSLIGTAIPTPETVAALDRTEIAAIYRRYFWDANLCGAMPAPLDGAVFDQCVNGGGATLLQRTLNLFYHGALAETGKIGGATLDVLTRALRDPAVGVGRLLTSYRTLAERRYREIVGRDKSQARFLAGWIARARGLGDV